MTRRSRVLRPRRLVAGGALLFAWCALWGAVSVANVASGLVVVLLIGRLRLAVRPNGPIRVRPLLRFARLVLVDLIVSTVAVAREILTPTDHTDEAVIAVSVSESARRHMLLLVVAITVTPGTAVVDTDRDRGVLYLHLLHGDRRAEVAAHIAELAGLAGAGLPVPETAVPILSEAPPRLDAPTEEVDS